MSEDFWKRLSIMAGLIVVAAIFGLMVFVANLEIKDLDLWLHIGMGRHIVNHNFVVPGHDILSCTISGKEWINHEWLFQVVVYEVFSRWGADGLIQMQIVLVVLTTLILLLLGYNSRKQLATIFMLLLITVVYQGRFTNRPDLFSLLFFASYIYFLSFYIGRSWSVYALFIIQVLWTNMHGFFFFGPVFVLIALVSEWLKRRTRLPYEWNRIGRLTDEEYRRLKMVLGLVVLACFLNPSTIKGALYPLRVLSQISGESKVFFENIVELQRPIAFNNIFDVNRYPYYKLLILLSGLSFFFNRRKIDISGLIVWIVFFLFSLAALRNVIFFAFAAYLAFVTNAMTLSLNDLVPFKVRDMRFAHIVSIMLKIVLCLWIVHYGLNKTLNGYYDQETLEWKSEFGGISRKGYPVQAVDFLADNDVRGNFLNGFNTGAYLIGRCFPDIKVFIDGRTEVYGPEFFNFYRDLWEKPSRQKLSQTVRRYDITGIFLHSHKNTPPPDLLEAVHGLEGFVPVYFDYDGVIYLKDIPRQEGIIKKHRVRFDDWQAYTIDLLAAGYKRIPPLRNIHRAELLYSLHYDQAALAEADQALRLNPSYAEPYKIKGKIYAYRKRYGRAFENLRIATMMDPDDRNIRMKFADMIENLGRPRLAAEHYEKILSKWPNDGRAYYRFTHLLIRMGEIRPALKVLNQAADLGPVDADKMLGIADQLAAAGEMQAARFALGLVSQREKCPDVQKKMEELDRVLAGKEDRGSRQGTPSSLTPSAGGGSVFPRGEE